MSDDGLGHGELRSYRILRRLGAGGMGSVYEGRMQLPLGKELPVAIKVMLSDPLAGAASLSELDPVARRRAEMFAGEALTSLHLSNDHGNLVTAYDFGASSTGRLFLVMELVHGPSLADLVDLGPVPAPVLRRVIHDVLAGLAHLHGHGVVHGDVSPGNILVSRQGVVKLADLGLSRRMDGTLSGTFRGTAAYASPESLQCAGVDATSDLYSLAAVLYEVLAGRPPHGADGGPAAIFGHMVAQIEAPVPASAPADLAALIGGLLRFHGGERQPASAREAQAVLERGGPAMAGDDELREFVQALVDGAPGVDGEPGVDGADHRAAASGAGEDIAFADTVVTLRPVARAGELARGAGAQRTAELAGPEPRAQTGRATRTRSQPRRGQGSGPASGLPSASEPRAGSRSRALATPRVWFLAVVVMAVTAMAYPVLSQLMPGAVEPAARVPVPAQPTPPPVTDAVWPVPAPSMRPGDGRSGQQRGEVPAGRAAPAVGPGSGAETAARRGPIRDPAGVSRPPRRAAKRDSGLRVSREPGEGGLEKGAVGDHFLPVSEGQGIHIVAPPSSLREAP